MARLSLKIQFRQLDDDDKEKDNDDSVMKELKVLPTKKYDEDWSRVQLLLRASLYMSKEAKVTKEAS